MIAVALLAALASPLFASAEFVPGDNIPLFVNTVGPYANPSETYVRFEPALANPWTNP
jgi:hypothetical protein